MNPDRTGAPLTEARHDRGLSTEIGRMRFGNEVTASAKLCTQLFEHEGSPDPTCFQQCRPIRSPAWGW